MQDDKRARLEVNGRQFPIVSSAEFTLHEWRDIKNQAGFRPPEFDDAIRELDPDAWLAVLTISIRRGGGTDQDVEALGQINLVELINDLAAAWKDATGEADAGDPPRVLAASATASSEHEPTSSENAGGPAGTGQNDPKATPAAANGSAAYGPETTPDGSGSPASSEPTPA